MQSLLCRVGQRDFSIRTLEIRYDNEIREDKFSGKPKNLTGRNRFTPRK